eukprot:scaffold663_cov341-Pavlova_lutheri.AAC.5
MPGAGCLHSVDVRFRGPQRTSLVGEGGIVVRDRGGSRRATRLVRSWRWIPSLPVLGFGNSHPRS